MSKYLPKGMPVLIGNKHAKQWSYEDLAGMTGTIVRPDFFRHRLFCYVVTVREGPYPIHYNIHPDDCNPTTENNQSYRSLLKEEFEWD